MNDRRLDIARNWLPRYTAEMGAGDFSVGHQIQCYSDDMLRAVVDTNVLDGKLEG